MPCPGCRQSGGAFAEAAQRPRAPRGRGRGRRGRAPGRPAFPVPPHPSASPGSPRVPRAPSQPSAPVRPHRRPAPGWGGTSCTARPPVGARRKPGCGSGSVPARLGACLLRAVRRPPPRGDQVGMGEPGFKGRNLCAARVRGAGVWREGLRGLRGGLPVRGPRGARGPPGRRERRPAEGPRCGVARGALLPGGPAAGFLRRARSTPARVFSPESSPCTSGLPLPLSRSGSEGPCVLRGLAGGSQRCQRLRLQCFVFCLLSNMSLLGATLLSLVFQLNL